MPDAGFWIDENVFRPDECDRLTESVCGNGTPRSRAGARHLMSYPAVATLACDPRLLKIARHALGDSAAPFRATLFEKSGRSNWLVVWHQDTALPLVSRFDDPAWGPWSEKAGIVYAHAPTWALARVLALRVHLDDSHRDNGPLRVIPNSHHAGVLTDEQVFERARTQAAQECVVARGSILAMRPMLIHSSSKSQTDEPRRVIHLEYADSLDLAPGIRLAIA